MQGPEGWGEGRGLRSTPGRGHRSLQGKPCSSASGGEGGGAGPEAPTEPNQPTMKCRGCRG